MCGCVPCGSCALAHTMIDPHYATRSRSHGVTSIATVACKHTTACDMQACGATTPSHTNAPTNCSACDHDKSEPRARPAATLAEIMLARRARSRVGDHELITREASKTQANLRSRVGNLLASPLASDLLPSLPVVSGELLPKVCVLRSPVALPALALLTCRRCALQAPRS